MTTQPGLKFSHYYGKMKHPLFTTIRRWDAGKEAYYRHLIGKTIPVYIEGSGLRRGDVRLVSVARCNTGELPADFVAYDVAYVGGEYPLPDRMDALLLLLYWVDGVVP